MTDNPGLFYAFKLIGALSDLLEESYQRGLAMQRLLVQKGLLSEDEIAGLMRAAADESEFAVEFGPEYEAYRRMRLIIREAGGEEPPPKDA